MYKKSRYPPFFFKKGKEILGSFLYWKDAPVMSHEILLNIIFPFRVLSKLLATGLY
jgi:hypothetical protein